MSERTGLSDIKKHQRTIFLMSFVAAMIPIGCQLLMLLIVQFSPGDFPKYDQTVTHLKFWPIQLILLCVAISGNAIVDFVKLSIDHEVKSAGRALQFLLLIVSLGISSLLFSVSILDAELGWTLLAIMFIFAAINLGLAYRVEIDIALIEAGLLA